MKKFALLISLIFSALVGNSFGQTAVGTMTYHYNSARGEYEYYFSLGNTGNQITYLAVGQFYDPFGEQQHLIPGLIEKFGTTLPFNFHSGRFYGVDSYPDGSAYDIAFTGSLYKQQGIISPLTFFSKTNPGAMFSTNPMFGIPNNTTYIHGPGTADRATFVLDPAQALKSIDLFSIFPAPSLNLHTPTIVGGTDFIAEVTLAGSTTAGGSPIALHFGTTLTGNHSSFFPPQATVNDFVIHSKGVDSTFSDYYCAEINDTLVIPFDMTDPKNIVPKKLTVLPAALVKILPERNVLTGGEQVDLAVSLNGEAGPSGADIKVGSNNPALADCPTPAHFAYDIGQTRAGTTLVTHGVATETHLTLSATFRGKKVTYAITLEPAALHSLSTATQFFGGTPQTLTGSLTGEAGAGVSGALSSDHPQIASVPAQMNFAAGQSTASVPITSVGVDTRTAVTFNLTLGGVHASFTSLVFPAKIATLTFNANEVVGGASLTGTIALTGPSGSIAGSVALKSSAGIAVVPATVGVPVQTKTVNFTLKSSPVDGDTGVVISATYQGVTRTKSIIVRAPRLLSVGIAPSSVKGGATATGTVNFSGITPNGTFTVSLSSNSANVHVPASVTVPSGKKSVTFTVQTGGVAASETDKISASYNGTLVSGNITVNP